MDEMKSRPGKQGVLFIFPNMFLALSIDLPSERYSSGNSPAEMRGFFARNRSGNGNAGDASVWTDGVRGRALFVPSTRAADGSVPGPCLAAPATAISSHIALSPTPALQIEWSGMTPITVEQCGCPLKSREAGAKFTSSTFSQQCSSTNYFRNRVVLSFTTTLQSF